MFRPDPDAFLTWTLRAMAGSVAAIVVVVAGFLAFESSRAAVAIGWRFATDASWHPAAAAADGTFGLAPMLWASVALTVGAMLIAGPLGVASALYAQFYAPRRLAFAYRRLIELMAGVPSVVFGFWGLTRLAPMIARLNPPGPSLLAGVVVLAVMVLPTVALLADAALAAVPADHFRAAAALALSRGTYVRSIALPAARGGIATGVLLATARAIGETMAVLMVCGNVVAAPTGLFAPVRALTANIALEMGYARGDHRSALFFSGLVLLVAVVLLVAAAAAVSPQRAAGRRVAGGGP